MSTVSSVLVMFYFDVGSSIPNVSFSILGYEPWHPQRTTAFRRDARQVRLLRAHDFGIGLSSPSKAPRIALADVLDQVRAKRDEAAPTVTACRRVEQPIAA